MTEEPDPQPEPELIGESNATELSPEEHRKVMAAWLAGMRYCAAPWAREPWP